VAFGADEVAVSFGTVCTAEANDCVAIVVRLLERYGTVLKIMLWVTESGYDIATNVPTDTRRLGMDPEAKADLQG
jgi:hypothetical protein